MWALSSWSLIGLLVHYSNTAIITGNYWLQNAGYAVKVYCDMERVCGCAVGRGEWGVDEGG